MNSLPDRERPATAYWVALASALYLTLAASAFCFWLNPQWFYWRAWEYFTDIVYQNQEVPAAWEGPERGDLSRRNLLFYQKSHATKVTTDQDGFRSTPPMPGPYRVAVLGDSTIFGSGLSDQETLPWQLAQELGVGVFNGARQKIAQVLGREDLGRVKLVIEGRTERALLGGLGEDSPSQLAYRPLRQGGISILECAPLELYFFPSIVDRTLGRLANDLQDLMLFRGKMSGRHLELEKDRHLYSPADLNTVVARARQRWESMRRLGFAYVLLPVPSPQTLYADNVDQFTRSFIPRLCRELNKEGIPCVDLVTVMERYKEEGLWQYSDTHWNGRATELAAGALAAFLRARGLAPGESSAP